MSYDVILTDPPWHYRNSNTGMAHAAKFYDLMSDQEVCDIPVRDFLNDPGVVFCWATCPRLDAAMKALEAWGLHYRGVAFVWVKTCRDGTPIKAQGIRASVVKPITELCLVASTKKTGSPLPLASQSVVQTVFAPRREHSRKPSEVQDRIDILYPGVLKLEMFARERRPGWDAWGDEVDKFQGVVAQPVRGRAPKPPAL